MKWDEARAWFEGAFAASPTYRLEVKLLYSGDDWFTVEVVRMYDRLELKFEHLKQISERFGTDSIDLNEGRSDVGCESCDHGSAYGVEITVRKVTKP